MRILLDTSVLWDPGALGQLENQGAVALVPAVAFTERARQIKAAGRDVGELWALLGENQIRVEDFTAEQGLRIATQLDDETWKRHARDALIAGHVGPDDVLWTKNPKDFLAVGLPAQRIVAC